MSKTNSPIENSEKLSNEYRQKYDVYSNFCSKIASILEQILQYQKLKYQIVMFRAKKLTSATMRFQEKKCVHLSDLKDLAGCRVIFYLESDINRFVQEIYNTFGEDNIVDYENKISPDAYNAVHIVIRLGKDRLSLPEYKQYDGLLCEIQLTTVLHHAWSEMEHDLVYKPSKELSEFDTIAFNAIKQGFRKTMKEHIQPAMRDFEYLFKESEKLKQGVGVFDLSSLKKIETLNSFNELEDQLKILEQYVEKFGDKTPKNLPITILLRDILIRIKTLKSQHRQTAFGSLKGATYEDVVIIILNILDILRYWHIDDVCEICFSLIKNETNKNIISKATSILENLCKYDLRILSKGVYEPQQKAIKFLAKTSIVNHPKTFKTIITMLEEILTLSFNGVKSSSYNSITFQPTSLNATVPLKELRNKSIKIGKHLFTKAKNIREKKDIILMFERGLRWPDHGVLEHVDDLEKMLASDTKTVLDFYSILLKKEDYEIIYEIEQHLIFLERDPKRKNVQTSRLLSDIANNNDYQIFRIFAGHDTSFYSNFDFEKAGTYRNQQINEYIKNFTFETLSKWKVILRKVIKNYKYSDPGFFNYFNSFLFQLAKEKPDIGLILTREKFLKPFFIHIVAGIWKSNKKIIAKKLLSTWCKKYENFGVCAGIFDYVEEINGELIKNILSKGLIKKDAKILNILVSSICRNYKGQPSLKKMFLTIINTLTELDNTYWTNNVWFRKNAITKDLSESEFKIITKNLLLKQRIDYDVEQILEPLVEKFPESFMDFLLKRVEISILSNKKDILTNKYDAIPYNFNKLAEPLRNKSDIIIPSVLGWYSLGTPKKDQWFYRWEAGHLLKEIFPNSDPLLEKELIRLIKLGGKTGKMIIDEFISRFEGEEFIWKLVEEVVNTYKSSKEYPDIKQHLFGYLSQTGVVSGEYGFVDAFSNKKKWLEPIKKTSNSDFLELLNEYDKYLDQKIVAYQKMADDNIDQRKREYGS